jgi:glycosyltransferase involved in cell wall biosynthesis
MYRLLIIADVEGWAYDRRAKAIRKYAPDDFEVDIAYIWNLEEFDFLKYDVVFNIEYACTTKVRNEIQKVNSQAVLISSHNADHRRCQERQAMSRRSADFIIYNNMEAYRHYGSVQGTCNISNGVDLEDFGCDGNERRDVALWTGSHQKGLQDFLIPLQKSCKTLGFDFHPVDGTGWDKQHGVNEEFVWPTPKMRAWYNSAKVVLCCSTTDATPNYVLEGMACGLVPVTTKVGNVMEFGEHGKNCVFTDRTIDGFAKAIEYAILNYDRMSRAAVRTISTWGWESRSQIFYDLFRQLAEKQPVKPFTYRDKSENA